MLWYQLRFWWETPKSEDTRGEAQGRNLLFAQLRLGAFWEVSRAFRDKLGDKVGGVNTWGKHLQRPGSCHCVSLTLVLWSSSYLWNLFNWFEFTKEWLIQNCLWQKIYIALIVQFRFRHCNGTVRGRKLLAFLKNHDCRFGKSRSLPFTLLTPLPHC